MVSTSTRTLAIAASMSRRVLPSAQLAHPHAAPKRRGAHLTPARTEKRRQPQRYKSPRVGGSATAPPILFDASVW